MTKKIIKDLQKNGIYLIYCPNESLGPDGPFTPINTIGEFKFYYDLEPENPELNDDDEIMNT